MRAYYCQSFSDVVLFVHPKMKIVFVQSNGFLIVSQIMDWLKIPENKELAKCLKDQVQSHSIQFNNSLMNQLYWKIYMSISGMT